MNNYILKACRHCGGDLARDGSDWICLQCGRYSYVGLYDLPEAPVDSLRPLPLNLTGIESGHAGADGVPRLGQPGDRKSTERKKAGPLPSRRPSLAGVLL